MSNTKKEFFRTLKFTLFSISAGLIQIGSFALLNELLRCPAWVSYIVSLALSVLWNFTLNRKFTFQSAGNIPKAMLQIALFYVVFAPLSTWWTAVLTGPEVGWNEYLVEAMTMIINFAAEYLFQRLVVFRKTIDTAVKKQEPEKQE